MSSLVRDITVNARYDLQAPSVLILYEQVNTINGQGALSIIKDFYPNPLPATPLKQFAALQFTVDLQGANTTITTAKITCEPISPQDPDWWLDKHPQYSPQDPSDPSDADNQIASFVLHEDTVVRSPNPAYDANGLPVADLGYTTELATGQLTDWMSFGSQRIVIQCKATVNYRKGQVEEIPLTFQGLSTNATSGTYRSQTIAAYSEPPPVGLAQFIFEAISVLQFEGELTLQEEDVSGSLALGQLFNLTGGANTEWNTMNAMVQSITENLDNGATTVQFGPPKNLSAGELVDLLRVNRARLILNVNSMRPNGTPGTSGGSVDLGQNTPEKNSVSGTSTANPHVVSASVDGTDAIIEHTSIAGDQLGGVPGDCLTEWKGVVIPATGGNPTPTQPAPGSVRIQLSDTEGADLFIQQIPLCMNGVQGTMYFLCSAFVPDPS